MLALSILIQLHKQQKLNFISTTTWYKYLIQPFDTNIWYNYLIQLFDTTIWYKYLIQPFDTNIRYNYLIQPFDTNIWYNYLIQPFDTNIWYKYTYTKIYKYTNILDNATITNSKELWKQSVTYNKKYKYSRFQYCLFQCLLQKNNFMFMMFMFMMFMLLLKTWQQHRIIRLLNTCFQKNLEMLRVLRCFKILRCFIDKKNSFIVWFYLRWSQFFDALKEFYEKY